MNKIVAGSHPVGVSHEILGRMRVRMAKSHKKHEHLTKVHDALQKLPHVNSVHVSPRTGSLVVHHTGTPEAMSSIAATIAEVGTEMLEAVVEGESLQVAGIVLVVHLVVKNISALVMRISERGHEVHKASSRVVHKTPGRTRVKVSKQHWCDVHKLEAALKKLPGVHGVHVNDRTKSVVVHHEEHEKTAERVGEAFEKVAVDLVKTATTHHSVPLKEAGGVAGLGVLAQIFLSGEEGKKENQQELRKLLITALLLYVVFKVRRL